jgi:hypothetical protein
LAKRAVLRIDKIDIRYGDVLYADVAITETYALPRLTQSLIRYSPVSTCLEYRLARIRDSREIGAALYGADVARSVLLETHENN